MPAQNRRHGIEEYLELAADGRREYQDGEYPDALIFCGPPQFDVTEIYAGVEGLAPATATTGTAGADAGA